MSTHAEPTVINAADIPRDDHTKFTPEELTRYATYHWVLDDNNAAHVWRTIAGQTKYMGTTDSIANGTTPDTQRELLISIGGEGKYLHEADGTTHWLPKD